ncbi:MAG: rhodanese-like domain-containing protein [Gammaproteobacteria bacterium]|jgi:rhodanese-related sulfurtransferase
MKTYDQLIEQCLESVEEIFPWDLEEEINAGNKPLVLDIREPEEYNAMRIKDSMNVPRGILEQSCEWDYEETVPELVQARDKPIVVVCRSGNRSVLAAYTMQQMGYENVRSLKTGLKGWNDYEQPLVDNNNQDVDIDDADEYFTSKVRPEQMRPK